MPNLSYVVSSPYRGPGQMRQRSTVLIFSPVYRRSWLGKNPLAKPPDYEKLPTPGNKKVSPETFSENNELKDLLNIDDSDSTPKDSDSLEDIESFIIKKIE